MSPMGKELVSTADAHRAIELYAEGQTLKQIAATFGVAISTLWDAMQRDPVTAGLYERAQEITAEVEVDELVEIADDTTVHPQQARNMIDTRKWRASKRRPKKYGDKLDLTITQSVDIAGAIAEGKARAVVPLVPVRDQHGTTVYEPVGESTTSDVSTGDNESPDAFDLDIFK